MVTPQPDIDVSEAIGGLAETVGKIAMDWNTKKKDTEIQSEYVSNTIILKEAQATFLKAREDDPNPLDDDYIKSGYDEYMKTNLKDLVWKHNTSQKKFEQTRQISDLDTLQKSYNINRRKFISAEKIRGETDTQKALNLRSKSLIDLNLSRLKPVYSTEALEDKSIKDHHDLEVLLIGDKLRIDPKANLDEFKKVLPEEKNKLRAFAAKEEKRVKQVNDDILKKERQQTEQVFFSKLIKNELTTPEIEASNLPATGASSKMYWNSKIGGDLKGAVVDNPLTYAELNRRAEYKSGSRNEFLTDVVKDIEGKKIKNQTGLDFIKKWDKKTEDVGWTLADKLMKAEIPDFDRRDNLLMKFDKIRNADPEKYKGRAGYDLAKNLVDEDNELNRGWFWSNLGRKVIEPLFDPFASKAIKRIGGRIEREKYFKGVKIPTKEKVLKEITQEEEETTNYSKYWE